jgi:predicted transport protein
MPLYNVKGTKLDRVKETQFKLEKNMQELVEANIKALFNLVFIKSEFMVGGLRIDTLAFDEENESFVIIEFKRDKNFSVIDQGYAYLALLLNNKADFILEFNESMRRSLKRDNVDWSQSRVVFISPEFTKYQRGAVNFKDLPIDLWEMTLFENGTILLDQLVSPDNSESIKKIKTKSDMVSRVSEVVKVYSETDHTSGMPEEIVELYEELKNRIISIGSVEVVPKKKYIGFKRVTNFVDIRLQMSQIKLWINLKKGELEDPKGMARDVAKVGHWGNGDYEIHVDSSTDLDYLMGLIKQSFIAQS